jgi:hypothetical protein
MLEIAYWLGTRPGVSNAAEETALNLDQYRDMRSSGRDRPQERDRWVMVHIHFDALRQALLKDQAGIATLRS